MMADIEHLRRLIESKRKTEKEILKVAQELFPIGATVYFEKWGGEIDAIIKNCAGGPRFKVENLKTGKEYWVDLYYLIRSRD